MENLVKWFLKRLDINRWYSENTIENYERTLKFFNNYLANIGKNWINHPEEITAKDADKFVEIERLWWKSRSTCNNYLAWIKLYLKRNMIEWRDVDDYRKILTARWSETKVEALSEEDADRLFCYFKNIDVGEKGEIIKRRNVLICDLLLYTWLRTNELTHLMIDDIWETVQVIWKWRTRRTIYLFDEDLELIKNYLDLRNDDSPYLIVSHCNNYWVDRLSNNSIDKIIRAWGEACWIKVRPHMLRHTFATNLLRKNAKLPYIQKLLGHKNIATTQTYLTVLDNELKETSKLLRK